ncbi:sulfur carrier protein ThiS [Paramixta manurensis]|uniref:Sulfur carrier protein ThiS n=1 Tax=Paramixta manurensis TaxID=2740817 RepID=A0A6M8UJ53_9GAMM|nr:sulfur carrier protein ThiS [Erwiniaceae bacterium PD-1]
MNIIVNDRQMACSAPLTLTALLKQLSLHQPSTALAVNQTIVPHHRWDTQLLQEGDELVIFQAIAGG